MAYPLMIARECEKNRYIHALIKNDEGIHQTLDHEQSPKHFLKNSQHSYIRQNPNKYYLVLGVT